MLFSISALTKVHKKNQDNPAVLFNAIHKIL